MLSIDQAYGGQCGGLVVAGVKGGWIRVKRGYYIAIVRGCLRAVVAVVGISVIAGRAGGDHHRSRP